MIFQADYVRRWHMSCLECPELVNQHPKRDTDWPGASVHVLYTKRTARNMNFKFFFSHPTNPSVVYSAGGAPGLNGIPPFRLLFGRKP